MVGRKKESEELNKLYNSSEAELVAIYGRRRVGKTYLVDEVFGGRFTFKHAGLSPEDEDSIGLLHAQLEHFYNSLIMYGMEPNHKPENWLEAFFMLEQYLDKIDDGGRQLVFIDELPWLDTPRSGFVRAFEGFWNNWACHRKNLMVVICGSANSWMLDKLINDHGGLYNRVTYEIKLSPFNLKECEELLISRGVRFSRYDIVQSYMIFGGIPYYLRYMNGEKSLAQNVDDVLFERNAKLQHEFDRLFDSIFINPESVKSIVRLLNTRNAGLTRKEIVEKLGITDSGRLSRNLNALISGDFVIKYIPFGMSKRAEHYKLVDPFCLFYLRFIENRQKINNRFWQQNVSSQQVSVWRGFAFENVCFNHVEQIKKALGISGVISNSSVWSKRSDDTEGVQIDLLIERNDNVINMCEIKFYGGDYTVNKDYYKVILHRQQMLMESASPKVSIHSTLITTFGLKHNEYSGAFTNCITLDELFQ